MCKKIVLASLVLLFLYGCQAKVEEEATNDIVKEVGESEVLKGELELGFDVNVNHVAEFTITLTNRSKEMKKLEFPSSQKYEIVITDEDDQEVYRYSEGKMFTQAIEYALIKPGESLQWEESWEYQKEAINPGKYKVHVTITSRGTDQLSLTKSITVVK